MNIALLGQRIYYFKLPLKVDGSFLMPDGASSEDLINIEAYNGQWIMTSNDETKIINGNSYVENIAIIKNTFYVVEKNGERKLLYTFDLYDDTFRNLLVEGNQSFNFGSNSSNDLVFNHGYVGSCCFTLNFNNGLWSLKKNDSTNVYINDYILAVNEVNLKNGDILFVYGLKIMFLGKILLINNPSNLFNVHTNNLQMVNLPFEENKNENVEVKEKDLYEETDYFLKSPRIKRFVEEKEFEISKPPAPVTMDDTPMIYILGPMLATGAMGMTNLANNITKLLNNETTIQKSWPQLVMAVAMLSTTLLWPNLSRRYKNKQKAEKEKNRQDKYKEYLRSKSKVITDAMKEEAMILKENLIDYKECSKIILNKERRLWERKLEQKDFLTVRVGTGVVKSTLSLTYKLEDFSMDEDNLKKELEDMVKKSEYLYNVPVGYSLLEKNISAVIGKSNKIDLFIKTIIVQLLAFHSYDELKIVVFTNEENADKWDYLRNVPHCFSDDKQIRFFASTDQDKDDLADYLAKIVKARKYNEKGEEYAVSYDSYKPYYLIFTDIIYDIRELTAINEILESNSNHGFSIFIKEHEISKLPSKCTNFISLGIVTSDIFENNSDVNRHQTFNDELNEDFDIHKCCNVLANIPIKFESVSKSLPSSLSFLEMYNVGKVEQLNSMYRWKNNNPIKSLKAEIGVDDMGKPIYLDLHEKAHGPHGLIAGMTGSGKSEFIITYILSLALNYSPNEVAFILIDYKGGGLVGAFENKTLGIKLPHLSGKITNLDKAEMKRTLVSINSELRRRQAVFNKVRDELGESTIDIYKYQRFFREGKIKEPVPHLFLISDEFAELKAQQPEFMDELISAARIGRSLGVHLILATQKPSGVVNDQIWSNSKFRVCLKVQDKSDSNEMIKCPDAAEIRQAGRFYLQVGYNEIFQLGQSGWCGAPYYPSNVVKKEYDRSVNFISDVGAIVASMQNDDGKKKVSSKGDELSNILKYIISVAEKENVSAGKMWLDSIPEVIYVDDLIKKYNLDIKPYEVTAVIGEYDDPNDQRQDILTIPFTTNGNTVFYSVSSSDRDRALNAILYSCSMYHSVDEINFYVVDFGAETLRAFNKMPHIGDMVFNGEKEKLTNLFKLIEEKIAERKKLFADYAGQYTTYCASSGEKLPLIVVILNDFDALNEFDPNLQEQLIQYCRDCERYGISFVLTCSAVNSLRSRLRQLFRNTFALEMNNKDDYSAVVGNWKNVCLFDYPGRGLVNLEEIYEFQTASILPAETFTEELSKKIAELKNKYNKHAPKIPVLPDVVTFGMVKEHLTGLESVPVGLSKLTLSSMNYDFTDSVGNLIGAIELKDCVNLVNMIIKELRKINISFISAIECDKDFADYSSSVDEYITSDFDKYFNDMLTKCDEIQGTKFFIIFEPAKLKAKMDQKTLTDFSNYVKVRDDIKIIFVNSNSKIRELDLATWYTSIINRQTGIWIGSGLPDQSVIRTNALDKEMRVQLTKSYGWFIKNGKNSLVKFIESEEEEDE